MSAGEIATSLLQFVIVVGVTFGLLCLITSFLRFQQMAEQAKSAKPDTRDAPTALRMQIAGRLGTAYRDPEPFVVLLIRATDPTPSTGDTLASVSGLVHQGIRRRDTLLQIDDQTLASVVGGTRAQGMEVAGRILQQFAVPDRPDARPVAIRIAVSSFPENGDKVEDLLNAAHQAADLEDGLPIRTAGEGEDAADRRPRSTPVDPLAAAPAGQRKLLDPVTGLLVEGHLGGVLQKRIAHCRKDELPGSVLAIEIDHLDRYVDHYGPGGIDAILRHLGCYLQGAVREDDLLARHQDDQVVIIMTAEPAHALLAAHRIAAGIRELEIEYAGTQLKVTASIGVAGYPDHGGSPRQLLAYAVTALEVAKARGRNLCLGYEPGMQVPQRAARDATAF